MPLGHCICLASTVCLPRIEAMNRDGAPVSDPASFFEHQHAGSETGAPVHGKRPAELWSAETCHRFRQATCRRRITVEHGDLSDNRALNAPGLTDKSASPKSGDKSPHSKITALNTHTGPAEWGGGSRDKDCTPPHRVSPPFRPASRRTAQASGLCYPVRVGRL